MSKYILTVGLEIHAELKTKTKMFCDSPNDTEEETPNVNICPVCMGYPGTLPVVNKEAVRQVLRLGVAVGGKLADYTEFDRKNYFYPDIPKGYQISQYKFPLVSGGKLRGVDITRVHLEEDTAKSTHDMEGASLLDFNRAGVPLMELVTEPVIHDTLTAVTFAKELQLILKYLNASNANMEKGEMRVEANISLAEKGKRGTKVEVKNLNSFKAVEKAIEYEIKRQSELLEKGEEIKQETRGWDENREVTFSQRSKEESHDYRYFPDPDLPKLHISQISEFSIKELKESLPLLPEEKREYYKDIGIKSEDAEVYIRNQKLGKFFEEAANGESKEFGKLISNYIVSDLLNYLNEGENKISISPLSFKNLLLMTHKGELSSRATKDILKTMITEGGEARDIAERLKLFQTSDGDALKSVVLKVISENGKAVNEYKSGNINSLQFLIGQAMKNFRGANPVAVKEILKKQLDK
ncbi:Asp-tRNA(Asn)/Glu-tRNA(Gln) amidotransferase subunit GatB [Candidatus Parcubacteria bacterium]|nr:Asp-tRNA(Asn)/Glu-tRNA(Gln) amidotransferase subunit GatB [Candidatus Parcubacteria bacterium]